MNVLVYWTTGRGARVEVHHTVESAREMATDDRRARPIRRWEWHNNDLYDVRVVGKKVRK